MITLLITLLSLGVILVAISKFDIHPFLALFIGAIGFGICVGGISILTESVQRLDILFASSKLSQTAFRFPRKPAPGRFTRRLTTIFKNKTCIR